MKLEEENPNGFRLSELGQINARPIESWALYKIKSTLGSPSLLHSRHATLRDDTKNGCVAD